MTHSGRRRSITQADVARLAGVSRPTVSLVMQGSPKVSAEKRRRVLDAAEELGYIGNPLATALAGNRENYLIGYLVQDLSNSLFDDVYAGMASELVPLGHRIVLMEGGLDVEAEEHNLRDLVALGPDGIVLSGHSGTTATLKAAAKTLPIFSVTRDILDDDIVSVFTDDEAGARMATEHLLSLGHRDIVHLQLPVDIPYEGRAEGYSAAMAARGLEPTLISSEQSVSGAFRAVSDLIYEGRHPSAFFCGNDQLALGTLDALKHIGLRVPQDVSVVGYDDIAVADRIGLTTVSQHAWELGRATALRMLKKLSNPDQPVTGLKLAPELRIRNSTDSPIDAR